MRKMLAGLAFAAIVGCQASPGFRMGWEFTLPPTLKNSQTLTPLPALPTTAYAVDAQGPIPMSQRQYFIQPAPGAPAPQSNTPTVPGRQLLPMPRESTPQGQGGCQPGPCPE
jgi:hypothetical protein